MSVEVMLSRAVLEDAFSPVLHKIAGQQDAFARRTSQLNGLGNVLTGAGSALIGFGVKSLKVAGEINEIRVALTAVEGAQRASFDMDTIDRFATRSKYTYLELAHAGERLALANVNVKDSLGDMADLAAASHKPLAQVANLYDTLLAGHNVSLALSARGGFSQFYISPEAIFKAAGKEYIPGKTKLQGSMTPQEVAAAVHKVLVSTGRSGLNEKLAHTTLEGTEGLIQDALVRIGNNVAGGQNITDTVKLLDNVATGLNKIADAAAKVPNLGETMIGTGVGVIGAGAVFKGLAAWRDYRNYLNLAKIAGDAERAGEAAKVGIAGQEARAVKGAADEYFMLGDKIRGTNEALVAENAEVEAATSRWQNFSTVLAGFAGKAAMLAGLAVAIQGVADASEALGSQDGASRVNFDAGYQDFRRNRLKAVGSDLWHLPRTLGHALTGGLSSEANFEHFANAGQRIVTDSKSPEAIAAFNRLVPRLLNLEKNWSDPRKAPWSEVENVAERLNTIVQGAKAYKDGGGAASAAGDYAPPRGANDSSPSAVSGTRYELDPAMSFKLNQDERRVALLKEMGGHEKELKAARAQEIADLNTAANLLERQAGLTTNMKAKYDLLNQAADDRQKAKLLGLEKADKRDKMDKTIATILGGGGLSEDEILKRAGVGRAMFARIGKGTLTGYATEARKLLDFAGKHHEMFEADSAKRLLASGKGTGAGPRELHGKQSSLVSAIKQIPKQEIHVHVDVGGKTMETFVIKAEDAILHSLVPLLEGSLGRGLYGSH